jgi:hypothetical protein
VFKQRIPHKSCFWETVQKHQNGTAPRAGSAAAEGDAVGQGLLESFNHGAACVDILLSILLLKCSFSLKGYPVVLGNIPAT